MTGSPLPEPVPITIEIAPPVPAPPEPPEPVEEPDLPTLPDRPVGEFVTSVDLALALADMIELTRQMIRDALGGLDVPSATEGFVTQEVFQAVLRDMALREESSRNEFTSMVSTQAERVQALESALATALSEIEDRRLAEIAQVEAATGFTPMAIFSGLGDLLRDPIEYVLEKSRDQIVEEISLGLNR